MTRIVSVRDAVHLVRDGATVLIGGSGAGHALPQRFIDELAAVFTEEGRPRDLTTVRIVGIGDFRDRGFSQLGLPGLMRRTIGSNIGNEPRLGALVEANEVEAYSFPQGVLSQLTREIAAGRPGLVTQVGLGTYVDPRLHPALLSRKATQTQRVLSKREREIMDLLAQGLTGEQVAERLFLSPETIKTHIRNAMSKLEANTRVHAIAIALREGFISAPSGSS